MSDIEKEKYPDEKGDPDNAGEFQRHDEKKRKVISRNMKTKSFRKTKENRIKVM